MTGEGDAPSRLGRYELITQLGQGGMATVQLALQRGPAGFEKLVVVKLVHKALATQKTFVDMLLDEARLAALVKHPNVVDIYDLGEAEGHFFIAMEYLEGEPLLGLLRAGREGKRLDPLSTARLIADTAEGLDAAHELRSLGGDLMELVHHDVSLGNIVVLYNGQVKLVDFGVAKASQNAGPQMRVHGKFGYMAPEKLRGKPGDRRSDIWSLGVVLWEALTLKRLFRGANDEDTLRQVLQLAIPAPSKINGEIPTDLDPIVMRALERDPDHRYANAKMLARDIEEVLRVHAYGGRNEMIANYMQSTFSGHITARKKLLQEVSSKGRASADVLEALFAEPAMITDMPPPGMPGRPDTSRPIRPSGEFSIQFKRTTMKTPVIAHNAVAEDLPAAAPPIADPRDIIERRRRASSEQMLAEGTPSSVVTGLPKSLSKQFGEGTPIEDDPGRRRGSSPRFDTQLDPSTVRRTAAELERERVPQPIDAVSDATVANVSLDDIEDPPDEGEPDPNTALEAAEQVIIPGGSTTVTLRMWPYVLLVAMLLIGGTVAVLFLFSR